MGSFSRAFRNFLWVFILDTIFSRNIDPNELFNKKSVIGLERVTISSDGESLENLKTELYGNVPEGYTIEVLEFFEENGLI